MIKVGVDIKDKDRGMDRLMREIHKDASHVDIGVHSDEDETLIMIASANEFGATIKHPGGTAYGYQTEEDAKEGRVKFLKAGTGFMVLGITEPHTIEIPPRPFIRSTMDENGDRYGKAAEKLLGNIVDGKLDKYGALEIMGQLIESDIKKKMTEIRTPANAPGTIAKKGSDNPLIDKGHLRSSIRYVVKTASNRLLGGG